MMVVLVVSRTPAKLTGLLTRWLLQVREGVFIGNVSVSVRRGIWERVMSDVGKGSALLAWPARTELGLEFASHNGDWDVIDSDGLSLMRRPTTDETLRRRALELYSGLSAAEINKSMAGWLRRQHPNARVPRKRTVPARLSDVRAKQAVDSPDESKSMQEGLSW